MIFGSDVKREVGKVYVPEQLFGAHARPIKPQPLLVLREASYEEWCAQLRARGEDPRHWPDVEHSYHCYEVSTD